MLLLPGNPASGLIPNGSGVLCPIAADQTGAPSPTYGWCNAGALQPHPLIKKVTYAGTASAPKLTVKGSGFGTVANLGPATASCGGAGAGSDYPITLYVSDVTRALERGERPSSVTTSACSSPNTRTPRSSSISGRPWAATADSMPVTTSR